MTQRSLSPIQDLSCGAIAGMSARLVVAPLDVVKIRFQVQSEALGRYHYSSVTSAIRTIVRSEGLAALWKGNVPAMLMVAPYAAIQLSSFYQLKDLPHNQLPDPYSSLACGAVSSSLATVLTYPLDLLRTQLAAQPEPKQYHDLTHAAKCIVRRHGMFGLYAGLRPTLVEIIPYMGLHFAIYEHVKASTLDYLNEGQLKPYQSMVIGATAGVLSKMFILPLDNVKKVMQVQSQFHQLSSQSKQSAPRYRGAVHILHTLWKRQGLTAWFRGAVPSLLKAAPNSAVTFAVYESAKRFFS